MLDQWKEHKISDPTVAAKFNTYRFADHKEAVVALLARGCTVSVETMKIVRAMPWRFPGPLPGAWAAAPAVTHPHQCPAQRTAMRLVCLGISRPLAS